jgi:glutamate racemase
MKHIGIIAGTYIDTKFGVNYYKQFANVSSYPISKNPQEQTKLQALNKIQLTNKVQKAIEKLSNKGVNQIIIYCNSLSGAISLDQLRQINNVKIITPLDIYVEISVKYNTFGLLAANCQSTANIEKIILNKNKNAVVLGVANLKIVNDIEKGISVNELLNKYNIVEQCNILSNSGAELIILGCTHFSIFYPHLKSLVNIPLLEPSENMAKKI